MKKNSQWMQVGAMLRLVDVAPVRAALMPGIYRVDIDEKGGIFLTTSSTSFKLPPKLYGISDKLVQRVKRTWEHVDNNVGVLLSGLKGTGKTVTAQQICNELGLPVILVNQDVPGLVEFLNDISEEVIVLFDEFEKNFKKKREDDEGYDFDGSAKMLTLLDGVLKSSHKKLYLMTTNTKYLNDNFFARPGRIRYIKEYDNLEREVVEEIVTDLLAPAVVHLREKVIDFISHLEIITVDVVTSVCQEVNIHEESPEEFEDVFNVKKNDAVFDIYEMKLTSTGTPVMRDGLPVEKLIFSKKEPNMRPGEWVQGNWITVAGTHLGQIEEIHNELEVTVGPYGKEKGNRRLRFEPVKMRNKIFDVVAF